MKLKRLETSEYKYIVSNTNTTANTKYVIHFRIIEEYDQAKLDLTVYCIVVEGTMMQRICLIVLRSWLKMRKNKPLVCMMKYSKPSLMLSPYSCQKWTLMPSRHRLNK